MNFRGPNILTPDEFAFQASNVSSTRPVSTLGAALTPGNNAMGTYVQCLTALAQDVYGILIQIHGGNTSAAARDMLVNIGVDPAGGSSYSTLIQELVCTGSVSLNVGSPISYYFPIWIKAGSTVAAQASVNNATVGTVRVITTVFGQPRNARTLRVGSYCRTFGTTLASSGSTAITSGTTSDGAWTQLGSNIATGDALWWWQMGMGYNNAVINGPLIYSADLSIGDGTNQRIVIADQLYLGTTSEQIFALGTKNGCEYRSVPGQGVYGRLQCSGTPDSGIGLAAYAVGG